MESARRPQAVRSASAVGDSTAAPVASRLTAPTGVFRSCTAVHANRETFSDSSGTDAAMVTHVSTAAFHSPPGASYRKQCTAVACPSSRPLALLNATKDLGYHGWSRSAGIANTGFTRLGVSGRGPEPH